MVEPEHSTADQERLKREAQQWVTRLTSGKATAADAEALHRWRQTSRAHRQAFAEANLLWGKLGLAAAQSVSRDASAGQAARSGPLVASRRQMDRRAILGGALAGAAAAAGYVAIKPPLDLWPSLSELAADYRTGAGQQRQIALTETISVKLNTRTSIVVLPRKAGTKEGERIELIAGEAAIAAHQGQKSFVVVAAGGQTAATNARFNVHHDGTTVRVTCIDGDVQVEHRGRSLTIPARQRVVYTEHQLSEVQSVDPEAVTAWERGLLVFRNDPVARVIEEVNRYRAGRIILLNEELGRRPVLATFRIDHIDEVVPRLETVFGVHVRTLPGGIVLLS